MVFAQLPLGEATAQKTLSFPTADGGVVSANPFGKSDKDVLLAHGGQFNKESWTQRLMLWWRQDLKGQAPRETGIRMRVEEISDVIRTKQGWVLLQVTDRAEHK